MKRAGIIALLLIISTPVLTSAKSPQMKGFDRIKGSRVVSSAPLGWPIALEATTGVMGTVQSLPGMSVVRLSGYKPWWKVWSDVPATTSVTISGLPSEKSLHVYTRGYREHNELKTTKEGKLTLQFASKPGAQFIIKSTPSTKHIAIDPLFGPPGGDCNTIGSWDAAAKKCTLNTNVRETIAIEDAGITLDGNNKSVIGMGAGDGIFTDESNVRVTNIEVHHFDRGIAFADSLFTLARGGQIDGTTLADNVLNIMDEGISDLIITDNDIVAAGSGISILDQFDGFATDGIEITRNNFKLITNNDVFNSAASIALNTTANRGNWWQKNTNCVQNATEPDHCDNSYSTGFGVDNAPWACENAWRTGVVCPTNPEPPPTGGETWVEISSLTSPTSLYADEDMSARIKTLPNQWVFKVNEVRGTKARVTDPTDNTSGWIDHSVLSHNVDESALQERVRTLAGATERKQKMISLLDYYFNNSATNSSLYSGNDTDVTGTSNLISYLPNNSFPLEVVLAMVSEESFETFGRPNSDGSGSVISTSYNNELVTYDKGYGLFQITTRGFHGASTGYSTVDQKCNVYRYVLVHGAWDDEQLCKFYTNTHQGIASNIKDGLRVLARKLRSSISINSDENSKITIAGAVWRYNGNDPINPGIFSKDYLTRIGYRLGRLEEQYGTDYKIYFPKSAKLYSAEFAMYRDLFTNYIIGQIKSPAYITATDSNGLVTGAISSVEKRDIPMSDYESDSILLFNTEQQYKFNVSGYQDGIYGIEITKYTNGAPIDVIGNSISIKQNEVHSYSINWEALAIGQAGVTISIDSDGDGKTDQTRAIPATFTGTDLKSDKNKITVCHVPPGNLSNSHEISVNQSAVGAHLAHGDYLGECKVSTTTISDQNGVKKNKRK